MNKKELALKKINEERNKRALKEQDMSKLKKEINELEKQSIIYQDKINKNEVRLLFLNMQLKKNFKLLLNNILNYFNFSKRIIFLVNK